MKKKGFTLIELIAVILILGVIILIITPQVSKIISKSKDAVDLTNAKEYVKAAEKYYYTAKLNQIDINNKNIINDLNIQSKKATGSIFLNGNGEIEMNIVINDKCYSKQYYQKANEITVSEDIDNCGSSFAVEPPLRCFNYKINNGEAKITGYKCGNRLKQENNASNILEYTNDGEYTNIIIPSKIENYPVVEISVDAFSSLQDGADHKYDVKYAINYAIIPDSVKIIESWAFMNNSLKGVIIPDSVTKIGVGAFYRTNLTNLIIPDSVTDIGSYAFFSNNLLFLKLSNNLKHIGIEAFNGNQLPDNQAFIYARDEYGNIDNSVLISYGGARKNNIEIPNEVRIIDKYAFSSNYIESITINNNITKIGEYAFDFNKLTSITIPGSVEIIERGAFSLNKLTEVKINGKNSAADFTEYGDDIWGWAGGYNDENIIWND